MPNIFCNGCEKVITFDMPRYLHNATQKLHCLNCVPDENLRAVFHLEVAKRQKAERDLEQVTKNLAISEGQFKEANDELCKVRGQVVGLKQKNRYLVHEKNMNTLRKLTNRLNNDAADQQNSTSASGEREEKKQDKRVRWPTGPWEIYRGQSDDPPRLETRQKPRKRKKMNA
jgi:hypothetical protein